MQLRTVQGVVEKAIRHVVREDVTIVGASRTDAGVHAVGQVAAFSCWTSIPLERLAAAINSRLPGDVQVTDIAKAPEGFSPISDAVAKGYRYRIAHSCRAPRLQPLFDRHFIYWTAYALDSAKMHEAAQHLIGTHDFASFTRVHHGRESTVRTIFDCRVDDTGDCRCEMHVAGDGFLYNMVRIIAGTLVEVGRGVVQPDDIVRILAARDRAAAGPTLPPEGLCLMWIKYAGADSCRNQPT